MLIKVSTVLLVCLYLAQATPLENEHRKPIVIDIPAGPPSEIEPAEPSKVEGDKKLSLAKEAIKPINSEVETIPGSVDSGSASDETTDFKPTFVIIRTRPFFSSFGSSPSSFFSNSPFGGGGSSGGGLFGSSPFTFSNPMQSTFTSTKAREPVDTVDSTETVSSPFQGTTFNRPSYFNVDDMMTRLQQQMSSLWGTLLNPNNRPRPSYPSRPSFIPQMFNPFDTSAEESTNTNGSSSSEEVFNIDKLPANYTNSTSETKVIDGNVVQVNRTIHKISSGNNTRGFFQFQVINVQPKTSTEKMIPTTTIVEDPHHSESGESGVVHEKVTPDTAVPVPTSSKPLANSPESDPALNEVEEKPAATGIDHGLLAKS